MDSTAALAAAEEFIQAASRTAHHRADREGVPGDRSVFRVNELVNLATAHAAIAVARALEGRP